MGKIFISGLINIETTASIGQFPVEYSPVDYRFFGVGSSVSGAGYNIAKAMKTLGDEPVLYSMVGNDIHRKAVEDEFISTGMTADKIKAAIKETPQSVILYDGNGKRKIIVDLKDIQETEYPDENDDFEDIDLAVTCNINFSRKLMKGLKKSGKTIATDLHVLRDINDEYNKEFMENADILFLSNEGIIGKEKEFMDSLIVAYSNKIIVIGMGDKGALMYVREDGEIRQYPAVTTRKVINTIGAGDALFSSFLHFYAKYGDPYGALENAVVFASYKIGESGAANGFLSEKELFKIKNKHG